LSITLSKPGSVKNNGCRGQLIITLFSYAGLFVQESQLESATNKLHYTCFRNCTPDIRNTISEQ